MEPTSYNLRKAAIRALDGGDFKAAASLKILSAEQEIKERQEKLELLRNDYKRIFSSPTDANHEAMDNLRKVFQKGTDNETTLR